uniref:Uncharacterized protein n=1 Tax=Oryza meridionalis TaxID=40149 RepID=A0A0E0DNT3_9ORYZ
MANEKAASMKRCSKGTSSADVCGGRGEYVNWPLAQTRETTYPNPKDCPICRTNDPVKVPGLSAEWIEKDKENMVKTAELLKELDDSFEEFQDQVRREVEEKGYYELGMDYFVQRAEYEAWLDKKLMG